MTGRNEHQTPRKGRNTAGSSASQMGVSLGFEAGTMRNRSYQRPGTPIPFGERPADRPMAHALGNGRNFAAMQEPRGEGASRERNESYYTFGMLAAKDPTYWRRRVGMKLWSWEQPNV